MLQNLFVDDYVKYLLTSEGSVFLHALIGPFRDVKVTGFVQIPQPHTESLQYNFKFQTAIPEEIWNCSGLSGTPEDAIAWCEEHLHFHLYISSTRKSLIMRLSMLPFIEREECIVNRRDHA